VRNLDKSRIRRILIRGVNWVGDSVLTLPAIELLRKIFPDAHLAILVEEELKPLFENVLSINEVVPFRKKTGIKGFYEEIKLIKMLGQGKWDMAVLFPNSFHSALTIFLARIPIRVGYIRDKRGFLLTEKIDIQEETIKKHQVEYYLDLVRNFSENQAVSNSPAINIGRDELQWAEEFLSERGVESDDVLIGISPGAAYGKAKRWFPERYAELTLRLLAFDKVKVIVFGGKEESSFFHYLKEGVKHSVIDTTGKTNLIQLAALLKSCRMLVTNDSGPMHIAAGVETPVIAIFGSSDPSQTGPLGKNHTVIKKEVSCSPCFERDCDTFECFEKISVEEVLKHVKEQL
jgi:heptosyltransferase II